jgi:hypothetical protein
MKNAAAQILFIFLVTIGCNTGNSNQGVSTTTTTVISNDNSAGNTQEPITNNNTSTDLNHKYSYVTYAGGAYIAGMIELYSGGYTQAVTTNGFTASGRGNWSVDGENISLNKTSGIAYNGIVKVVTLQTGEKALVLSNGITYVEDDNGSYIKKLTVTAKYGEENSPAGVDGSNNTEIESSNELTYTGSASDPQSGTTQEYTLKIKSDFRSAAIGGGPFTTIEDQGDGSYMWLYGTIIGMSFRPTKSSCAIYGSDGNYFCTLYRR